MQEAIWVVALLVGVLLGIIGERWRVVRAETARRAAEYAKRVRTRRQKKLAKVDKTHAEQIAEAQAAHYKRGEPGAASAP
jgi:hypothetical protein